MRLAYKKLEQRCRGQADRVSAAERKYQDAIRDTVEKYIKKEKALEVKYKGLFTFLQWGFFRRLRFLFTGK